jgi:hypothetical protein
MHRQLYAPQAHSVSPPIPTIFPWTPPPAPSISPSALKPVFGPRGSNSRPDSSRASIRHCRARRQPCGPFHAAMNSARSPLELFPDLLQQFSVPGTIIPTIRSTFRGCSVTCIGSLPRRRPRICLERCLQIQLVPLREEYADQLPGELELQLL